MPFWLISCLSESLVFRAESYTCSPTVIHVVRILQANKEHPLKYPTLSPGFCGINKKKAVFSIGKVGYILSMLEQIGNMIRYDSYMNNTPYNHVEVFIL